MATRFGDWMNHHTYIYISDGGIQEEISQGVGRIAGYLGLGNIIMFYDANDVQLSTKVGEVTSEDTAKKYESWHWHVIEIDGNDEHQIRKAISECQSVQDKPSLIIGRTIMGKGAVKSDGSSHEGEVQLLAFPLGSAHRHARERAHRPHRRAEGHAEGLPHQSGLLVRAGHQPRRQGNAGREASRHQGGGR